MESKSIIKLKFVNVFSGEGEAKERRESHLPLSPDPYPFRLSRLPKQNRYGMKGDK